MSSVTLENIHKHFGDVRAVDGISLHVEDGEFIALLGPSGCGKTTTLRMVAGLENPTSGTISIGARDVTNLAPRDRDIAMVFQDYALYPHMTVMDNIGYPLKVRGTPRAALEQRVTEVAKNLQIGELLKRRPGQLSGGQQQRASVARAVVHQAQVFLFDEPLSNLDAKLRLEARAFLKHLQRDVGVTALYVTHDQAEAMALADRIVVMRDGKIMQAGTPLEVYRVPANTFVASFIGSPPMNLLPCTLDSAANALHFTGTDATLDLAALNGALPKATRPGEALSLGIRPENIVIHNEASKPNTIPAQHYVTQTLGGEILVILTVGETLISVRIFEDEMDELPDRVWLELDLERVFFYGEDGDRIT